LWQSLTQINLRSFLCSSKSAADSFEAFGGDVELRFDLRPAVVRITFFPFELLLGDAARGAPETFFFFPCTGAAVPVAAFPLAPAPKRTAFGAAAAAGLSEPFLPPDFAEFGDFFGVPDGVFRNLPARLGPRDGAIIYYPPLSPKRRAEEKVSIEKSKFSI
jgi:hypothetical protein